MKNKKRIGLLLMVITCFGVKAQDTGPNAPDFMGFEPVDASDMVSLMSGDMTYSLPLLEVPGPGGGYPITLSNHAGIGVDSEASWVGLGWRLTAGSISRSKIGVPDDAVIKTHNIFHASGSVESYSLTLGLGVYGVGSIAGTSTWGDMNSLSGSVSLMGVSLDTEGNIGLNAGALAGHISSLEELSKNSPVNFNVNYNYKTGKLGASANLTLSDKKMSSLGISLSSNGSMSALYKGASFSMLNMSGVSVSENQSVTTKSNGGSGAIPLGPTGAYAILGFRHTRHDWKKVDVRKGTTYGVLNPEYGSYLSDQSLDVINFDYDKASYEDLDLGIKKPSMMIPGYDVFNISSQGMNTSISANYMQRSLLYSFQRELSEDRYSGYGKANVDGEIDVNKIQFLENSSTANYWEINGVMTATNTTVPDFLNYDPLGKFAFTNQTTSKYKDRTGEHIGTSRSIDGKLGGLHVEWFTNEEISDPSNSNDLKSRGFIETPSIRDNNREDELQFPQKGIGAFSVTNKNGVTYHYSLPVYQRESLSFKMIENNIAYFNSILSGENGVLDNKKMLTSYSTDSYAMNWLLTAITGPDYIDMDNDGQLDENDYGYWVEFDYGQLTDGYLWRNINNYNKQMFGDESITSSAEYGFKDVYYLNSIATATHTAFFVKGTRDDGLSAMPPKEINSSKLSSNGCTQYYKYAFGESINSGIPPSHLRYRLMKLDRILLLKNSEIPNNINFASGIHDKYTVQNYQAPGQSFSDQGVRINLGRRTSISGGADCDGVSMIPEVESHERFIRRYLMDNIFDYKDYTSVKTNMELNAIKHVQFNYDENYGLMKNSENSMASSKGKLTLSGITEYGRGGHQLRPPFEFEYYNLGDLPIANGSAPNYFDEVNRRENYTDEWGYFIRPGLTNGFSKRHNWSLKRIKNPIGAEIDFYYENDSYHNEYALGSEQSFQVTSLKSANENNVLSEEFILTFPNSIGNYFEVGDQVELDIRIKGMYSRTILIPIQNAGYTLNKQEETVTENIVATIESISSNNREVTVSITNDFADGDAPLVVNIPNVFVPWLQKYSGTASGQIGDWNDIIPVYTGKLQLDELDYFDVKMSKSSYAVDAKIEGGGLRVDKIELKNGVDEVYTTKYTYNKPGSTSTSGVTSYSPKRLVSPMYIPYVEVLPQSGVMYEYVSTTTQSRDGNSELTNVYHFDVPTYSVNEDDKNFEIPGFFQIVTTYDQQNILSGDNPTVLEDGYEYHEYVNPDVVNPNNTTFKTGLTARKAYIFNQLANIGRLKKISSYNNYNQLLEEKEHIYNSTSSMTAGIQRSTYLNKRFYSTKINNVNHSMALDVMTSIANYSSQLKETITTKGGLRNSTFYKDYDVVLGIPRTVITEDSFGDRHRTKTTYAHEVYPEMGLKSSNINNKNMLTQEAASYLYFDNGNNNYNDDPVLNASIITWKKQWKYREFIDSEYKTSPYAPNESLHTDIWRKKTTYNWRSKLDRETGAYLKVDGSDDFFDNSNEFDFNNEIQYVGNNLGWIQNSEITLYNHYSNSLEVKDVNGKYVSSKQWDNKTVSSIVGAAYSGYCASTAEELIDGNSYDFLSTNRYLETETMIGNGHYLLTDPAHAHTGKHSVRTNNGSSSSNKHVFVSKFKTNSGGTLDKFDPNEYHVLSVWVKGLPSSNPEDALALRVKLGSTTNTLSIEPEIIKAGEWSLVRYTFQPASSSSTGNWEISVGVASNYYSILYFDDYRLYPVGASMTTYVYDDLDRVEYILDGNNLATKYQYNDRGQLWKIYTEKIGADGGFVLISESTMNYVED